MLKFLLRCLREQNAHGKCNNEWWVNADTLTLICPRCGGEGIQIVKQERG